MHCKLKHHTEIVCVYNDMTRLGCSPYNRLLETERELEVEFRRRGF